jgi:hypothetical protein
MAAHYLYDHIIIFFFLSPSPLFLLIYGQGASIVAQAAVSAAVSAQQLLSEHHMSRQRLARRQQGVVSLEDAIMNVSPLEMDRSDIPSIDRQWYITIYPHTYCDKPISNSDLYQYEVNSDYYKNPFHSNLPQSRMYEETYRTAPLAPFNKEKVDSLSFASNTDDHTRAVYLHLSDISRYSHIEVILFMAIHDNIRITSEECSALTAVSMSNSSDVKESVLGIPRFRIDEKKGFLPVFSGVCDVRGNWLPCLSLSMYIYTPLLSCHSIIVATYIYIYMCVLSSTSRYTALYYTVLMI